MSHNYLYYYYLVLSAENGHAYPNGYTCSSLELEQRMEVGKEVEQHRRPPSAYSSRHVSFVFNDPVDGSPDGRLHSSSSHAADGSVSLLPSASLTLVISHPETESSLICQPEQDEPFTPSKLVPTAVTGPIFDRRKYSSHDQNKAATDNSWT